MSLFVIALNIVLAITLAQPKAYGISGLALAQSIVAMVEVFILSCIMLLRDPKLFEANFWSGVLRILSVTGFSVVAAFITVSIYRFGNRRSRGVIELGSKLFLIAAVTLSVCTSASRPCLI